MAELVDALVSGTSVRKDVQVRVLFWALLNRNQLIFIDYDFFISSLQPQLQPYR
jgi:hypothetical protein